MLHPSPQIKSRNASSLAPDEKSEYFIPRPRLKVGMLHPSPQIKSRNASSLAPDEKSEYFIPRPRLKVGMLHPSPQMKSRNTSSLAPDKKSEYFIPRPRLKCLSFKDFCSLVLRLAADAIQLRQSQAQWPAAKYANLRRYAATQVCYKNMRLSKLRGCNWKLSHQVLPIYRKLYQIVPHPHSQKKAWPGPSPGPGAWAPAAGARKVPGRCFFFVFFPGFGKSIPRGGFPVKTQEKKQKKTKKKQKKNKKKTKKKQKKTKKNKNKRAEPGSPGDRENPTFSGKGRGAATATATHSATQTHPCASLLRRKTSSTKTVSSHSYIHAVNC